MGTAVSLLEGKRRVRAVIVEDRGPLGVGGRRLYRIEVAVAPGETISFEMPEDDLLPEETGIQVQPA